MDECVDDKIGDALRYVADTTDRMVVGTTNNARIAVTMNKIRLALVQFETCIDKNCKSIEGKLSTLP